VQTRARALDNNFFVIAPNVGTYYLTADDDTPIDTFGGHSMIVDYLGRVVGEHPYSGGSSWVAGTIDIHALRHFRPNARWGNWMKDLTTEQYRLIYEQPVYPKNLYADARPTSTTSTAVRCSSRRYACCRSGAATRRRTAPPPAPDQSLPAGPLGSAQSAQPLSAPRIETPTTIVVTPTTWMRASRSRNTR
jgi:hypothetical protein